MTYSSKHSSNTQISRSRIVSHFVNEGFFVYECIYVCNASTSFLNTTFKLKGLFTTNGAILNPNDFISSVDHKRRSFFYVFLSMQ